MVDELQQTRHDIEDEQSIMLEIEETIAKQRASMREQEYRFAPRRRGVALPLLVNAGSVVLSLAVMAILWQLFVGIQESYVLQSATLGTQGADIIAALLAEARASLENRDTRISEIEEELASLDQRIADLDEQIARLSEEMRSGPEAERDDLMRRREDLGQELSREIELRDQLRAQVATQQRAAGEAPAVEDPLQVLREQQQLVDLFQRQVQARYRGFTDAVGLDNFAAADAELAGLESFLRDNPAIEAVPGLQQERLLQIAMAGRLRELLVIVQDGFPEPQENEDSGMNEEDLLPGWGQFRQDLSAAQQLVAQGRQDEAVSRFEAVFSQIPGLTTGMGLITTRAEERSVEQIGAVLDDVELRGSNDPELMLREISEALALQEEQLPPAIQRLTVRLVEAVGVVEGQRQELEELTATAVSQLALLQEALGETGGGTSAVTAAGTDAGARRETATSIAARIETLRDQAEANEVERQELVRLLDTERAALAEREGTIADLQGYQQRVERLTLQYRQGLPEVRRGVTTGTRTALYEAFEQLLSPFDAQRSSEFFPDLSVLTRALVESLIQVEAERAAATAEEQILLEMMISSERIADEQVRMLARGSSVTDSMALLDSLIREIDSVAQSARDERQDVRFPRPMGTVVDVRRDGIVTVRRALDFAAASVRRLYFSRVLPNGDRVPIGEGEIIATSGENVVLRVVNTIAPTIFPEINDVVYVEF